MISVDAGLAIAALLRIAEGLPDVVATAVKRTGRIGLNELHRTRRFVNRTWQLNESFRFGFTEIADLQIGVLDIDPSVQGLPKDGRHGHVFGPNARKARRFIARGGQTSMSAPAKYGYFLQWGTKKMHARPFMTDARDVVAETLPGELNDGLRGLFDGAA